MRTRMGATSPALRPQPNVTTFPEEEQHRQEQPPPLPLPASVALPSDLDPVGWRLRWKHPQRRARKLLDCEQEVLCLLMQPRNECNAELGVQSHPVAIFGPCAGKSMQHRLGHIARIACAHGV